MSGRAVVVRAGGSESTGYLLAPRLVLTGYLPRAGAVRLALPGHADGVPAEAVWSQAGEGHDAALLRAERPLLSDEEFATRGPLIWASVGAAALGDVRVEHYGGEPGGESRLFRETCEFLLPAAEGDRLALRVRRWLGIAGLIGAPVLAGTALVALVGRHRSAQGHLVTPAAALLRDAAFARQLAEHGVLVTDPARQREAEERWRAHVVARYGELTVTGPDGRPRAWPLDAVWSAPEVTAGGGAAVEGIEQVLAARRRVLLWGPAGAGKTTVVRRLAVAAARRQGPFADSVPFVLPLLELLDGGSDLPPPGDLPRVTGFPMVSGGWVTDVFAAGRALVLVDGVDETPSALRDRVGAWLAELLARFPGNRWLVASRPDPAPARWWRRLDGFAERFIGPLSADATRDLVRRWHRAVGADEDTATALLDALRLRGDLTRLAANPLLCTLLCTLHLEHGHLLRGRAALLDALLDLLRRREVESAVPGSSSPAHEARTEVLQRLAHRLMWEGRAELPWDDALWQVEAALADRHEPRSAAEFLDFLVAHSGVVHRTASGGVVFLDRAFLDHFAGRAAALENDPRALAARVEVDRLWEDVFRSAVAFARPRERAELLALLLERGESAGEGTVRGVRLRLLALSCLTEAPDLDPEVRAAVLRRCAGLIPPSDEAGAALLAAAGPLVLELLPAPGDVDVPTARLIRDLAAGIGGPAGTDVAERFAARLLRDAAGRDPWGPERPAVDTAGAVPAPGGEAPGPGPEVLRLAAGQRWTGNAARVHTVVSFGDRTVGTLPALPAVRSLALLDNRLAQDVLGELSGLPRLRSLVLRRCVFDDLSVLAATGVMFLELSPTPPRHVLNGLAGVRWLRVLFLPGAAAPGDVGDVQAAMPSVLTRHDTGELIDEIELVEPTEVRP